MIPRELLSWLDRLVLLRELEVVGGLQGLDVISEAVNGDGRVGDHGGGLVVLTSHLDRVSRVRWNVVHYQLACRLWGLLLARVLLSATSI